MAEAPSASMPLLSSERSLTESMVEVKVPGVPQPQGSMRAFIHKATQRVIMTSDNRQLHDWRLQVGYVARSTWRGRAPLMGPVELQVDFVLPRPGGHYKPRKLLSLPLLFKKSAPEHHTKRPDLDKLIRGIGDALKACGIYADDSQINHIVADKRYVGLDEEPFVRVRVFWG